MFWETITVGLAFLAVMGWLTAWHQHRLKEEYKEKYRRATRRNLGDAAEAVLAPAAVEFVRKLL